MIAQWSRKLSDQEIEMLKADPYCFLKPVENPIKTHFWTKVWEELKWWFQRTVSRGDDV